MTDRKIRIFLNGFGRIGRTLLRILAQGRHTDIEIVGINDIEPLETCAYLFEYDSVFGTYPGQVEAGDGAIVIDGLRIPFHDVRDLRELDLAGVDVVLECTGMAGARAVAERGLQAGAEAVLISGPAEEADKTLVMGANEDLLGSHKIISNASCTTNALAPLLKLLDAEYGLISGHMTTVHCYTGSQPTVDKPRGDLARSRAAALSMVPTTTSAGRLIDKVLPDIAGRVLARAIRVPTASVSAIDLTIQTDGPTTVDGVNTLLKSEAAKAHLLGWTEKPLVSTDLRARPESLIVSGRETSVSVGGLLRVFGWYDNEWGFSNRMLDMARLMGRR
ncbi:type I glyceraldehyde-3-phosphate dehydrogenase [Shimia thalassica]|uniref:Glyceraldehyde-3-phosphate dehydrogenase n=1 Tax=Shimia thalassica TaxID=1715693 RepID=A0A0P1I4Y1_9RHOB|nr:type I glyceraldehyde-3-phosphate dehydrogenase [Shimia thalassica]MDO6479482.1 type I glyceraldehyde-3-phosphate dehydrogenase [Shimia thalassica]MDO6797363.1 type I glyceraldehyde-3-phosphate dehydrogenase [Shimia thalassica]MDP2492953.1 type I glyceraldehyde-3-phosphate dehydrogenase [Shimia thalassica]CUJ90086.1 Glyceraldehyde-3-phosphate dehydrogenase [Shimia thalassica]